jgi:predicted phosphodiesterase
MSDLHIEFAMPKSMLFEGENLILAGDITCLRALNPTKTDSGNRKLRDRTHTFFRTVQENFKRVFYVTGNHESYDFDVDLEAEYIAKYLPGVIHLNDSTYNIDDNTVIMGGTLWTDMNDNDDYSHYMVGRGMNDFRLIEKSGGRFSTLDAYNKHMATKSFLTKALEENKDKNVIVVTHHAPTYKGINPVHTGSALNAGYASNLEDFILDRPQIKYFVFGHTHIQKTFQIGDTWLVSNARGYEGYESSATTFKADTWFEVS